MPGWIISLLVKIAVDYVIPALLKANQGWIVDLIKKLPKLPDYAVDALETLVQAIKDANSTKAVQVRAAKAQAKSMMRRGVGSPPETVA